MHSNETPCAVLDTDARERARHVLDCHGEEDPAVRFGLVDGHGDRHDDALATALMDLFRRTRGREVFESLVELTRTRLGARVRSRVRFLGAQLDPQEVLQDAYINVYRYPDKFDGRQPGAFKAWASTIVDNTIRRHLRRAKSGPDVALRPDDLLMLEADTRSRDACSHAIDSEACELALSAYSVLLTCYMDAFGALSERERFVLQMVEVRGMRYAELAKVLGIRPEALKMVVFRARRRILMRVERMLAVAG